jgi:hypothetical protein
MVQLILPPNVEHDRETWTCLRDIGEILLRPDTQVDAPWLRVANRLEICRYEDSLETVVESKDRIFRKSLD